MEVITKDFGKIANKMEKEEKFIKMEISIMEIGLMINNMVKENFNGRIKMFTKEILKIIKKMEKA